MTERTHDEFCFNTDLYQDDVEGYMCICNRLDNARQQAVQDAANAPDLHPAIAAIVSAAEQRVLTEAPVSVFAKAFSDGKAVGYDKGLDAARDAVAALMPDTADEGVVLNALAAIDALRGEA